MAVYFARAGKTNRVKIGCSTDVGRRISTLQTGCPDILQPLLVFPRGDYQLEKRLHEQFAGSRVIGEWFEYEPEILAYVQKRLESRARLKELEEEFQREREEEAYWEKQEQDYWDEQEAKWEAEQDAQEDS
jgi:hypothetical protein